jgi:DNA-binding CsgD family transcriptional regulator
MNKYEPISSGLFSVLLQDAAFEGTLLGTLAAELGRLLPPDVVVSILSRNPRDGGTRTIIYPPHAAGAPQRIGGMANVADRAFEGTVYSGPCGQEDGATGGTDSHVRLVLRASRQRRNEIELRFPSRKADQLRPDLTRLMQAVGPDLVLAFRIGELAVKRAASERLTDALLDLLPLPTLLLDRRGALRRSNAQGAALLAQGTAIIAGADGRIHAINRTANTELHAALDARHEKQGGMTGPAAVVTVPDGGDRVLVKVRHLTGAGEHPVDVAVDAAPGDEPATILVAQRIGGTLSLPRGLLEGAFALTTKEADLAQSLLNGDSIAAYAMSRRMSKQTLRNQVSGILRKTGTKRQAELIGLLTRLAFAPAL